MISSTVLKFFSLLPLALAVPTYRDFKRSTCPAGNSTSGNATATSCPTADFPVGTAPYFYLKTDTIDNPSSSKNNLYLTGYHVEAALSVAVLLPKENISAVDAVAYLNNTYVQIGPAIEANTPIFSYLLWPTEYDEVATSMMISPESGLGDNDAGEGFFFNSTTTESGKEVEYLNSTQFLFVAFLACDWFGTAGEVQLIPQSSFYWEGGDVAGLAPTPGFAPGMGKLPANCEAVRLVKEDIIC